MGRIITLLLLLTLIATGSYALFGTQEHLDKGADGVANNNVSSTGKALIGGDFRLTDTQKTVRTDKDFLGQYTLVFFGFTQCPDVCPTTLTTISSVMDEMNDSAEQITPIFITIDPDRDSPDVMKEYLQAFHPSVVGLTGSHKEIKQAVKAYKVYTQYGKQDKHAAYEVMHSGYVYFMNNKGEYITHFSHDDSVEKIVSVIRQHI